MITKEFILIIITIAVGVVIALATYPIKERTIDCSIAEISPDYTNAMKEACRKERMVK